MVFCEACLLGCCGCDIYKGKDRDKRKTEDDKKKREHRQREMEGEECWRKKS